MATVQLNNTKLKVEISSKGAELTSIQSKSDCYEYLWQADPEYWNRHAPILFPIVGKLKEDQFVYDGKKYHLTQHGFARDLEFNLIEKSDDKAIFGLENSLNSLSVYPFHFALKVIYQLIDNKIKVTYRVENVSSDEKMYFSVGAHPAFNVPNFENAKLSFASEADFCQIPVNEEVLLKLDEKQMIGIKAFDLSREVFKEGVLIYETPKKTSVLLDLTDINKKIKVSYDNMDSLGIWSPYPKDAPFVCIEPWCGLADEKDASGEFVEKYGIKMLEASSFFDAEYTMTFE